MSKPLTIRQVDPSEYSSQTHIALEVQALAAKWHRHFSGQLTAEKDQLDLLSQYGAWAQKKVTGGTMMSGLWDGFTAPLNLTIAGYDSLKDTVTGKMKFDFSGDKISQSGAIVARAVQRANQSWIGWFQDLAGATWGALTTGKFSLEYIQNTMRMSSKVRASKDGFNDLVKAGFEPREATLLTGAAIKEGVVIPILPPPYMKDPAERTEYIEYAKTSDSQYASELNYKIGYAIGAFKSFGLVAQAGGIAVKGAQIAARYVPSLPNGASKAFLAYHYPGMNAAEAKLLYDAASGRAEAAVARNAKWLARFKLAGGVGAGLAIASVATDDVPNMVEKANECDYSGAFADSVLATITTVSTAATAVAPVTFGTSLLIGGAGFLARYGAEKAFQAAGVNAGTQRYIREIRAIQENVSQEDQLGLATNYEVYQAMEAKSGPMYDAVTKWALIAAKGDQKIADNHLRMLMDSMHGLPKKLMQGHLHHPFNVRHAFPMGFDEFPDIPLNLKSKQRSDYSALELYRDLSREGILKHTLKHQGFSDADIAAIARDAQLQAAQHTTELSRKAQILGGTDFLKSLSSTDTDNSFKLSEDAFKALSEDARRILTKGATIAIPADPNTWQEYRQMIGMQIVKIEEQHKKDVAGRCAAKPTAPATAETPAEDVIIAVPMSFAPAELTPGDLTNALAQIKHQAALKMAPEPIASQPVSLAMARAQVAPGVAFVSEASLSGGGQQRPDATPAKMVTRSDVIGTVTISA